MHLLFLKKSGELKIIVKLSRIPIYTYSHFYIYIIYIYITYIYIYIFELGSWYITQDILEFLGPQNPLTSVSWVTGTSM